jgi:hypothetical protein
MKAVVVNLEEELIELIHQFFSCAAMSPIQTDVLLVRSGFLSGSHNSKLYLFILISLGREVIMRPTCKRHYQSQKGRQYRGGLASIIEESLHCMDSFEKCASFTV